MKKLIFCDFDGVLHPIYADRDEWFSNVPVFLETIAGFEGDLSVVITSGHRNSYDLSELKALLPSGLRKLVIGKTPSIKNGNRYPRYVEIEAYIKETSIGSDWRALDDEPSLFPKSCQQLILCKSLTGFDYEDAEILRAWLGIRMNPVIS